MSYTPSYLSTTPNIVSPPLHSYGLGTSNFNNGNSMDWLGVANLGLNALSGIFGMSAQDKQNKLQQQLAQQQMQWQSDENEKAFQRNVQMFNMENAYNDPSAVMARLKNAGVNPFVAFGSGGAASGMTAAGSGHVTNGGVSPVMPNLQAVPTGFGAAVSGIAQGISQYANVQKTIAEAKKAGAETWRLELMAEEEVKGMRSARLLNEWQLSINQKYGDRKASLEVRKLCEEINKLGADINNAFKEGNLIDAKTDLTKMQKILTDYEGKIKKKEHDTWEETYNLWKQLQNEYIATEKSTQKKNEAAANESNTAAGVNVSEQKLKKQAYDFLQESNKKQLEKLDNELQAGRIDNACKIIDEMFKSRGVGAPPLQELMRKYVENRSAKGMSASEFVQDIFKSYDIDVPSAFIEHNKNKPRFKPSKPQVKQYPGMRW